MEFKSHSYRTKIDYKIIFFMGRVYKNNNYKGKNVKCNGISDSTLSTYTCKIFKHASFSQKPNAVCACTCHWIYREQYTLDLCETFLLWNIKVGSHYLDNFILYYIETDYYKQSYL